MERIGPTRAERILGRRAGKLGPARSHFADLAFGIADPWNLGIELDGKPIMFFAAPQGFDQPGHFRTRTPRLESSRPRRSDRPSNAARPQPTRQTTPRAGPNHPTANAEQP